MELLARAIRLAAALGSDSAACCPLCLASFAEDLSTGLTERELDRLRTDAHSFWDACIKAVIKLSAAAAPELCTTLEAMAATCSREHVPPKDGETDAVRIVVRAACRILHVGLAIGGQSAVARASKSRTAFASSRGYWPTDAAQLFPGGPRGVICALVHWESTTQSCIPIGILADLAAIAHPFVYSTIMSSSQLHADILTLIVDRLRSGTAAEESDSLPLQGQDDGHRFGTRKQAVAAAAVFLAALQSGPDASPNDVLRFLQPRAEDIFHAILYALDSDVFDDDTQEYKLLAVVANRLQQHLDIPITSLPAHVLVFRGPELGIVDIIVVLLNTVRAQKRRCSGPRCGLYAQERDRPFRRCAGCETVYYCSRECQLRDWREGGQVRHRQVCATIPKLLGVTDYFTAYAACSYGERAHVLTFALAHTALHDELRERALELVASHHSIGARVLGALPLHVGMQIMREMFD